jgi:chaperonin GroEL (HSP60 family)
MWAASQSEPILREILAKALMLPIYTLYRNAGFDEDEANKIIDTIKQGIVDNKNLVYDLLENEFVDAIESGLLDSAPAVSEAIKNSLSISGLLGTCGGTVVFKRDLDFERSEAKETADFARNANHNFDEDRW